MITPTLISSSPLPNGYGALRIHAPALAAIAAPGHRVQLNNQIWPLMNASAEKGWIELLYPSSTFAEIPPAQRAPGAELALGPLLGKAIDPNTLSLPAILIADIQGLAATMFFLYRAAPNVRRQCLVFLQSDDAFPFQPRPSLFMLPGVPPSTMGCAPLCEDMRIPSRLGSQSGLPGCYDGSVADLLDGWLRLRGRGMVPQPHVYALCSENLSSQLAPICQNWGAQIHYFPN